MSRRGRRAPRRHDRPGGYRDQQIEVRFDVHELLLVRLAAELAGVSLREFAREAVVNMAMVAVDAGRKWRLARDKGLPLYGVTADGEDKGE